MKGFLITICHINHSLTTSLHITSPFQANTILTWFVAVDLTLRVTPRVSTPEGSREAPLAEGVETRQQFGLSVVEAQLADRTGVHEPEGALLFQPLLLGWQTFRLVFHDNDNVVVVNIFGTFIHFLGGRGGSAVSRSFQSTNQCSVAIGNKG